MNFIVLVAFRCQKVQDLNLEISNGQLQRKVNFIVKYTSLLVVPERVNSSKEKKTSRPTVMFSSNFKFF